VILTTKIIDSHRCRIDSPQTKSIICFIYEFITLFGVFLTQNWVKFSRLKLLLCENALHGMYNLSFFLNVQLNDLQESKNSVNLDPKKKSPSNSLCDSDIR